MEPDEAKEVIGGFIGNAKEIMRRRQEEALWKIVRLRWWEIWKVKDIARQALGIGKYWNQEFKK